MFKRINVALMQPKLIGQFLNDKKRVILGYLLFLLLLLSLPIVVKSAVSQEMEIAFKESFEKEILSRNLDYKIIDYKLNNDQESKLINVEVLNSISFNEKSNYTTSNITDLIDAGIYFFNFTSDSVEFYFGYRLVKSYSYKTLSLNGIDFNKKASIKEVINAIDFIYRDNKFAYESINVISFYISEFIIVIIFIGIMTYYLGLNGPKLKRKYRFLMATYGATAYLFSSLLALLFDVYFLRIIGFIWGSFNIVSAYKHLIFLSTLNVEEKDSE